MRDGVTGTTARPQNGEGRPGSHRQDAGEPDAEERYRELVRLAYFVQPGRRKRTHRMALARRIVECTSGLGGGHARRRTRVLRRAMKPTPLWRIGLRPWLRATPSRMPAVATTNALSEMKPPVRVAHVLLNVAGMSRYEARDQLLDLRIPDQMDVIEAAGKARVPVIKIWPHSDPFAKGRIRPLGRRSPRPVPVGVAVAVTAALAGGLVMVQGEGRLLSGTSKTASHGLSLVAAAPGAWRTAPHSLDVWPARGELAADKNFTGRALKAWADATKPERAKAQGRQGNPQLLFAGTVDGRKIALLRRGDRIGRFTGPDAPLTVTRASTDAATPITLSRGRYLLAPWQRAESLAGKKVTTRQGVTDPVSPRTRCGLGPVLNLSADRKTRTVGEFGGPRAVPLSYRSPKYVAGKARAKTPKTLRGRTHTRLAGGALRVFERSACAMPRPRRPVSEVTAWEFWSGLVPGSGRARWVCGGMSYADGGSAAQATLLAGRETRGTGWCDTRRPVGGSWWRSARGDWYYLAAAARGLAPRAEGPFRSSMLLASRLLIAVPSERGKRPDEPVKLKARSA